MVIQIAEGDRVLTVDFPVLPIWATRDGLPYFNQASLVVQGILRVLAPPVITYEDTKQYPDPDADYDEPPF
jgi:hypothetical protein